MPAPKMILDGVSINQPPYGYTAEIYTGIKWDMVGDGYRGYINGKPYFKANLDGIMLTEDMQSNLKTKYGSNVTLQLQDGSGLYPFSPLFNSNSYSVRILDNSYSGVLQSPWKYTENSISLLYNTTLSDYENATTPNEGSMIFRDCQTNEKIVTGIREIESTPEIKLPENHNTQILLSGLPSTVEYKRHGFELAGITSDIEVKGSGSKVSQILKFLLAVGINSFYITLSDYYLFGRNKPMHDYYSSYGIHAWEVKCISNPIQVVHDFLNMFTIKISLALVR
jgi:hypothetical protein